MASRVRLRSLGLGPVRVPAGPPSVDDARAALGGRASTVISGAGERVRIASSEGVVVFASTSERDVWIGEGRFRRVAPAACEPIEPMPDPELDAVAADARRFAAMSEGDPVRFRDRHDGDHAGQLVEKCRYGALVLGPDERVIAVSFRRLTQSGSDL